MEPGGSVQYLHSSLIILFLNRINLYWHYFSKKHSKIVLRSTPRPSSRPLFYRFTCKIWKAPLHSCILSTCLAHPNLRDLITLTKLVERYKVRVCSSSLCSLLQSPFLFLGLSKYNILRGKVHGIDLWPWIMAIRYWFMRMTSI